MQRGGAAEFQATQPGSGCRGLETSRGSAGGGQEQADIEGASSRSRSHGHGPAAERPQLGLGQPESTHWHCWTGTTCRAAQLVCSDWSDVGLSLLDRVEGGGDNRKPGRTGFRPRCAVAGVLIQCASTLIGTYYRTGSRFPYLRDWAVTIDANLDTVSLWMIA